MADEQLDGWTSPIAQGIADPFLLGGVAPQFLILNCLGTMLGMMFWWRVAFVGLVLYVLVAGLTIWEVAWWKLLKAYYGYAPLYEG